MASPQRAAARPVGLTRLQVTAGTVRDALVQVLTGPEPAGPRRSRTEGRAEYVVTAAATLLLCLVNATHVYRTAPHGAQRPGDGWQVLLALAVVLPLPLAARHPMAAWRAGWLALVLAPLLPAAWWGGWPWGVPQLLALLWAFCLAGVRQQRPVLWWMGALTLVPWGVWLVRDLANLNGPVAATVVFAAVAIAVDGAGSRLRAQEALATQTVRTDAERSRRAVLEERTRIARELHDVVAHHLSLIAVQAETAPYRLGELPEATRAEFGSLSEVAREALTEMRRLLGVLRQDRASAGLSPQPRLNDLPALVDAARRAGVRVELSVPEELGRVPDGVGVCAYRIVQESLSNAGRHAPGAAVSVSVSVSPPVDCDDRNDRSDREGREARAVRLRVANGPGSGAAPARPESGIGHGLTGMRERVGLLGGSLSAGPTPTGGFVVSVVLPLGGTA
ncbi:sensor histidine kinase [Streptacidiphilus carbonis]|uniref:sensor histidine kinase n=1 Tax=Streptacidiphilus carbonis TaxID=105422 RepID=UPI000693D5EB|nr:histidine kinase [Streptacidiphilus carbonis]